MAAKQSKRLYIIALALLVSSIGYLAATGFAESTVYELTVNDIASVPSEKQKTARLSGKVLETAPVSIGTEKAVRFRISDIQNETSSSSLQVLYYGVLPDTFKAGSEVIIEGGYNTSTQEFTATKLMTKCPSKYEEPFKS